MAIKITTDQLDASILDKLTRLDAMESSYKKENGNVVMYNGDNFYTGKFPEMPKQKVVYFSYNEIADMREALYKSNSKYKSAADTYMTMGKIYASNFARIPRTFGDLRQINSSIHESLTDTLLLLLQRTVAGKATLPLLLLVYVNNFKVFLL